ncbi:DUF192 domain-containing protein [uncultured Algibacter sp.]|uniref:DUF192 domain-containing protein n=1 Tax=uncultured Algibacter sp. TaxID=298659 RepID=UPI002625AE6A|nr:DUF192 domain-containing protein [uncultured Algibacter sp.]
MCSGRYILFVLTIGVFSLTGCKKDKKVIQQTKVTFTKEGELTIQKASDSSQVSFDIEISDSDFDVQTGLMYRDSMEKNQGMLFIFEDEKERYFYMKNTKIPLDLLYINSNNKIVSFQKNAKPFDESSLPSNSPAQYVLEINAGLIEQLALKIGDSISFIKN